MGSQPTGSANPTTQGIKDLTSNTVSLLNALGVQDAAAVNVIGGIATLLVGAASLGPVGIVGAIVGILGTIISLFSQGSNQNAQVLQQLKNILESDAEQATDNRLATIQNLLTGANIAVGSLNDYKNMLPLSSPNITQDMQSILSSLVKLAPPDVSKHGCPGIFGNTGGLWNVPYDYQTSWTDADSPDLQSILLLLVSAKGYGQQAPATSGNVFSYTYVLPAYVFSASIFVSTGMLIDPNFQQDWRVDVATATCLLQSVHDYIWQTGLTQLSPGPCSYQNILGWGNTFAESAGIAPPSNPAGTIVSQAPPPGTLSIEYGAVERFSGFSSVGLYTFQGPFSSATYSSNTNYDGEFQIRLKRRVKDVYTGTGLKHLQDTINSLNAIIGQPASAGPGPADWSFRNEIAEPLNLKRSDGTYHLSDVMAYLKWTPPADGTLIAVHSFRTMLSF